MIPADVRCIGYVRVSTERQAGEVHTSLADQSRAIEQRAAALGFAIGAWYRDEGASGATVEKRPALQQLLADCAASKRPARTPGYVVCLNDSRFGRFADPEEAAYWRVHLAKLGWQVRFAENDASEDRGTRTLVRAIGGVQASAYREQIVNNAKRGNRGTTEQGFWVGRAPFGYRRRVVYPPSAERVLENGVLKAPNEKVALTPHEDEAAHVRWMYETYAAGLMTLNEIARAMRSRAPGRQWGATTAGDVLRNPAYMGDVVSGRRPGDAAERRETPERPRADWYGKQNAHPAIVSRDLFAAVEQRMALNARHTRAFRAIYLVSGILQCTHCGSHYNGGGVGTRTRRQPLESVSTAKVDQRLRFYKCTGGVAEPSICPGPLGTVARHIIDDAVLTLLAGLFRRPSTLARIAREFDRALAEREGGSEHTDAQLAKRERDATRQRDRLVSAIASGTLRESEAAPQLAAVREELARVVEQRQAARFSAREASAGQQERERLLAIARDFPALAARSTGPALRELVRPWIAGLTFDKVERLLTLDVWLSPVLGALQSNGTPGSAVVKEGARRPWRRQVSLVQPGHESRVIASRAAVEADRARMAGGAS